MGTWSETLESAKEDVRNELIQLDPSDARDYYEIVDGIADSHVPVYFSSIFDMVMDARLSSIQPENPPEDVSPESVARIVIYEELQNLLNAYAEQVLEDTPVCADGHFIDDENGEEVNECFHCGDKYCADPDHGRACDVCGEATCSGCRAYDSEYGRWVCDDCDASKRQDEEDEAEAREAAEADEAEEDSEVE